MTIEYAHPDGHADGTDGYIHLYGRDIEVRGAVTSTCIMQILNDRFRLPWRGSTANPDLVTCPICRNELAEQVSFVLAQDR